MPTGYTAEVVDGTMTDFASFAMRCARAFGATIEMREEPLDAKIPDRFQPSNFYARALLEAEAKLSSLRLMTEEQVAAAADASWRAACQGRVEYLERAAAENKRCADMIAAVEAWQPPTPEHVEMKAFMRQQLTISMTEDPGRWFPEPERLTPAEWLAKELQSATADVARYTEKSAKEAAGAESRTEWVRQLRESLDLTVAAQGAK